MAIVPPFGAFPVDLSFASDVLMVLNVEYKKRSMTPSGHLWLHLHDKPSRPDLTLRATSFDWLVAADDRAWISGAMTVEGRLGRRQSSQPPATYRFLVSMIDGQPGAAWAI